MLYTDLETSVQLSSVQFCRDEVSARLNERDTTAIDVLTAASVTTDVIGCSSCQLSSPSLTHFSAVIMRRQYFFSIPPTDRAYSSCTILLYTWQYEFYTPGPWWTSCYIWKDL